MSNFALGCVAVALIMIAPELCDFVARISKEK